VQKILHITVMSRLIRKRLTKIGSTTTLLTNKQTGCLFPTRMRRILCNRLFRRPARHPKHPPQSICGRWASSRCSVATTMSTCGDCAGRAPNKPPPLVRDGNHSWFPSLFNYSIHYLVYI